MICGIYKIENLINHKIYIGQSIDIKTRWYKHKSSKDDLLIHRALQKYGSSNFSFDIIEECPQEELNDKEKYYIKYYNSLIPTGYNMTPGGNSGTGITRRKKVLQYDLEGNYLKTFDSILEASRQTKINDSNISSCCKGNRNYAGGFQWRYQDNNSLPLRNFILEQQLKVEKKKLKALKQKRIIIQLDFKGQEINRFQSCSEASRVTGIHLGNINACCNKKRDSAGGYKWIYKIEE